jgi:hypothetical protein
LTISLPLPWTLESFWLLFQLAVQLAFVLLIVGLIGVLLVTMFVVFMEDLRGGRAHAWKMQREAEEQRAAEEAKRRRAEEEWRERVQSALERLAALGSQAGHVSVTCGIPLRLSFCAVDGLNHCVHGSRRLQAAFAHQRPPREEAQRQPQYRALLPAQFGTEHLAVGCHLWPPPHLGDFSYKGVVFGIA